MDVVMDASPWNHLSTKAAYDKMLEQGNGGRIIMTSSTSGLLGNFGQTNYGAAKAGIAGFMRCLWLEESNMELQLTCWRQQRPLD